MRRALAAAATCLISLVAPALHAAPQTGFYWNPAEPGRGFFVEKVGDWFFFAGLLYGNDGRPTWVVSNDPMPDANVYDGRLLSLFGGQTLAGPYQAPAQVNDAGAVHIEFGDDTHATLTWPGGNIALERELAGGTDASGPQSGMWWNASESGRGFALDVENGHIMLGAMMYDPDGAPVWYVADGLIADGSRFQADLLRFSNGQTMDGAYVAPGLPAIAGSIELDFTASDRATLTLADLDGVKRSTQVELRPQHVKPPLIARPKFLDGSFSQVLSLTDGTSNLIVDGIVTLERIDDATDGSAHYVVQSASANVRLTGYVSQDEGSCAVDASSVVALTSDNGRIDVQADGVYSGVIDFQATIDTVACAAAYSLPVEVRISLGGTIDGQDASGPQPGMATNPNAWTRWNLVGRNL